MPEAASQSLAVLSACRQNPSAVRTERRVVDRILMVKGDDELARSRIQSLAVLSALAVRIRAPSGLNAERQTLP